MSSVSNFAKDINNQYVFIDQYIDGADIPEESTFVGFDAVIFARKSGQVAVLQSISCDKVPLGTSFTGIDTRDGRWEVKSSRLSDDSTADLGVIIGPSIRSALNLHGDELAEASQNSVRISQTIEHLSNVDYIGDGPMDLSSKYRYDDETLPAPGAEASVTKSGGLIVSEVSNIDPSKYI